MGCCGWILHVFGVILVLLLSFSEVLCIICPKTGETCDSCCDGRCCVDADEKVSYTYSISFWNLWYFWFVVLFILMSCFGGCGYYKHRQQVLSEPRDTFVFRGGRNARNTPGFGTSTGQRSTNVTNVRPPRPVPSQPLSISMPPPYSEVVKQPGKHFDAKPPPYPGRKPDIPASVSSGGEKPPDYYKQTTQGEMKKF
ncbi:vesicular, overexpressed in cancer, prosurvival protein 1-like [Ostrea edulis]|uniref:vesicular, overexpressed in cancer, prosurvival protein 1-like n=1 Tax=Ostrea edulis TaxID=37623 RepID=UPI002095A4AA|nr:vesicular, overexpressed in cancer, prosurvival protein 1-like [Ostrea edulis]